MIFPRSQNRKESHAGAFLLASSPSQSNPSGLPAPPKWEPLAVHAKLMVLPRALPLGELDAKRPERASPLPENSPSHRLRDASPLGDGASGGMADFSVLPRPPSMREVSPKVTEGVSPSGTRPFYLSPPPKCDILKTDNLSERGNFHENSRKRLYPRRQVPCR